MIDLYTTPLGTTARTFFAVEAEKKYRVGEALLVLPSDLLVKQASCESKIQAVNFEYLPNRIVKLNRSLLQSLLPDLPQFGNLKKISRRTQELLVGDLLRQLDKLHGLDYFSKLTGKEGFIKAVTSLLGQLSRSGATQEEITNALSEWEDRNSTYALKDRELSALYNLYRSKLRAKNCYDLEGIYRLAILVLENEAAEVPWQHLYFSEFYHFDGLQRLFLRALAKHCDLGVGLVYEPKRPEIFNAVERSYGYLSGFARLQELEVAQVARSRSLQHLLTALGTGAYQQEDNAAGIQFFEACDKEGELRAVLRSIKKQLQQGSVYSDFLVVLRDFNTYSGIRAICDEYGVPVTLAQSSSLGSQSLVEFLRLLLTVAEGGSEAVPAYWRLLKCSVAKLCWHFDGEKLNLLKQKNFYNKLSQLQQDVITASFAEGDALVGELEALQQLVGRVQTRATVAAYGELFKEVLQELALPYKVGKAYSDGKASLCQVKNMAETVKQLVEVLDTLREDYESGGMETVALSAADFCRLLHSACAERQVVLTEADSNGILFGEAANLQGMLFKHVYIMGLREGEFPRNKNENWIYSDWERTYLSSIGIELDNTATSYAEDKFFFAAVATMATESLTLSWYSDDVAGASAYVEDVERLYAPGAVKKQRVGRSNWQESLSAEELQVSLSQISPKHNWLLESLGSGWPLRSSIEQRRASVTDTYSGLLIDRQLLRNVNTVLGGEFSASNLETYAQCPFRFLLSYVWKQQQYEELSEIVEPTVEGSLLHDVLAIFMAAHLHEKLTKYPVAELLCEIDDIMTSVCEEYIGKKIIAETDFWPSQRRRLLLLLHRWLSRELDYQKIWEPFVPVQVEWDFGKQGSVPLSLTVNNGRISLNGRIDRIDEGGGGLFITDYKRSITPTAGELIVGLDLQMPVYLLALTELEPQHKVLGGGYYSLKEGRRKGGFALRELGQTPFTVNNKIFEDETDQWGAFADFCRMTIKKYVDKLQAGSYPPAPRKQCPEYCPGRDICRAYGQLVTEGGEDNV